MRPHGRAAATLLAIGTCLGACTLPPEPTYTPTPSDTLARYDEWVRTVVRAADCGLASPDTLSRADQSVRRHGLAFMARRYSAADLVQRSEITARTLPPTDQASCGDHQMHWAALMERISLLGTQTLPLSPALQARLDRTVQAASRPAPVAGLVPLSYDLAIPIVAQAVGCGIVTADTGLAVLRHIQTTLLRRGDPRTLLDLQNRATRLMAPVTVPTLSQCRDQVLPKWYLVRAAYGLTPPPEPPRRRTASPSVSRPTETGGPFKDPQPGPKLPDD